MILKIIIPLWFGRCWKCHKIVLASYEYEWNLKEHNSSKSVTYWHHEVI
jgi:hypothetical protein